jgi:hypothetical protein
MRGDQRNSHHLATVSFDGRFWDAYLELVESQGPGQPARGRIAFSAPDLGDVDPVRTTTIFIEDTPQEVVVRAREFKTHQLVALLRSAIPPDLETARSGDNTGSGPGPTPGQSGPDSGQPSPGPGAPPSGGQGEPADEL